MSKTVTIGSAPLALTAATPADIGTVAAVGVGTTAAHSDHVHIIPNDAVTYAKLQNISATDRLLGRDTAAAGDAEELTVGGGVEFTGTGGIQRSALTGDVTAAAGSATTALAANAVATAKIADNAVTLAKLADVATATLLGRTTAATGDPETLTLATSLEFSGNTLRRSALTGDVTAPAGSNATTIAADAVTTAKILNDAVTYAKLQNISATDRLLGRDTAAAGDAEELTVGGGVEFTGSGGIQRSALTGDVTATAGSGATTIATAAVTLAKMANVATDSLIGRDTAASGVPEVISVGGGLEFTGSAGIQVANNIPARGGENVSIDLMPATQQQGTCNTAGTATASVATTAGKRYTITADVWVEDGSEVCLYAKAIVVRAYRKTTGDAIIVATSVIDDPLSTALFTFVASVSTNSIVFTLSNTSGTNREYNMLIGSMVCDLP